jgi:hypothetical protein
MMDCQVDKHQPRETIAGSVPCEDQNCNSSDRRVDMLRILSDRPSNIDTEVPAMAAVMYVEISKSEGRRLC